MAPRLEPLFERGGASRRRFRERGGGEAYEIGAERQGALSDRLRELGLSGYSAGSVLMILNF